ncbi:hypothetical protein [Thalassomonas viridans]|nr:hypothetical protein [Thalassomonas viridans]
MITRIKRQDNRHGYQGRFRQKYPVSRDRYYQAVKIKLAGEKEPA